MGMALALTACQAHRENPLGPAVYRHAPDVLRLAGGTEPEWIDPGRASEAVGGELATNLFSGLLTLDPVTGAPVPEVAHSWQLSPDGRTYTFHLRASLWSDGRAVTAEDFVYSWRRVLDPSFASSNASLLSVILGAEALNAGALLLMPASAALPSADACLALARALGAAQIRTEALGLVAYPQQGQTSAQLLARAEALLAGRKDLAALLGAARRVRPEDLGVAAPDAHTLVVKLNAPTPYFLHLAAFHALMPVPAHLLRAWPSRGLPEAVWTQPETIVSNGPFVLARWRFKRDLRLKKNLKYFAAQQVALNTVDILTVEDVHTAMNMYATGEIDWTGAHHVLPSAYIAALSGQPDLRLTPHLTLSFYWFNTRMPPLDRLGVRQALSLSVDRKALTERVLRSGQLPTAHVVPPGLPGYPAPSLPLFDPETARRKLAEAGFPGGLGLPPLTLTYNTADTNRQVAEAIQAMWQKHLGIHVRLANQEWKVYLGTLERHDFQIGRAGWVGDYPDANSFLHELLTSQSGNNHSQWRSPDFDALLHQAAHAQDPARRQALLGTAELLALEAQPMMPLYTSVHGALVRPYLRGISPSIQGSHPFRYISLDPAAQAHP